VLWTVQLTAQKPPFVTDTVQSYNSSIKLSHKQTQAQWLGNKQLHPEFTVLQC